VTGRRLRRRENMEDDDDSLWRLLNALTVNDPGPTGPDIEEEQLTCSLCGGTDIISEEGQHVCKGCATVVGRVIDCGAEWRFYGADDSRGDDPTRCGMPTNDLLPKSSLGSMIGGRRGDSREIRRIRRFQMWNSMPHSERALYAVFDQLKSNTIKYGLPAKVIDDAMVLYKQASEQKISRGENKEGLVASCIYYGCLINKIPRSAKEVSRMFNIHPNVLTKGNARFQNLLKINVDSSGPEDFIARFGSKLDMTRDDIQKCKDLAARLEELEIVSENAPTSVAAGALYYYSVQNDLDLNKLQIASACDVSEVTITKCFKKIMKYKAHIN
jgi:transcription initiation factor TFIIB